MTGKSMGMNIRSIFKPRYSNSLRCSRKQSRRSKALGKFFPSPDPVRDGRMVLRFTQIWRQSLENVICLKSKDVGSGYQPRLLVELSVWDRSVFSLTCEDTGIPNCFPGDQNSRTHLGLVLWTCYSPAWNWSKCSSHLSQLCNLWQVI